MERVLQMQHVHMRSALSDSFEDDRFIERSSPFSVSWREVQRADLRGVGAPCCMHSAALH